ncbi:transporter substrate-binding domain-containing protein [Fulvivirga sp. 29W222]|uniref:Transporter substrate-binding domain-containing protein n=1 Tax=Fulvivirga marina TaxID=2494733 RepID=A0A937FYI3_9BACT|nr:transporter substrate-binding domain-containing protein [Fulvivirga marina]MBL6448364.1 transporter substrate-binding domain-containing protein [Fulvivirga marina]
MKTNKLLAFFSISVMFLVAVSSPLMAQYSGDSWKKIQGAGSGTVSFAYVETPGFVYKDKSGKLTGICVDIMNDFIEYVNETKGVKVTSKFVGDGSSFTGMYNSVKGSSNGVFGLGNITITSNRKKEIKFSPPFITNFAILITQKSVPTLNSLDEISVKFKGLTAYTAKGTLNDKRTQDLKNKYYPDMKIAYAASSPATLDKVLSDPKAFSYLDLAFYLDAVQRKQPLKRHPIGDQASEQFGFVMPMNSDWQPLMEEFFNANGGYTNSVAYKKILSKHLGDTGVKLLQTAK